jgi:8-hydroxy-5-deazaflavin:NADPH oxidoreductase
MEHNRSSSDLPTLAILGGTGNEGPGLALRWAYSGYKILIGSRQAEKAQATADEINQHLGIDTVEGLANQDAAARADISVLTVVHTAHEPAVKSLKEALQGKILVDATARVDFRNPVPPPPPSAARYAQDALGPNVRVVAAFQNVPAHVLKKNLGQRIDTDVLVCAEDLDAADQVIKLAEDAGMHAYFAGGLDNGVAVEGITSLLISMNKHYRVRTASVSVTGISVKEGQTSGD